MAVRRQGSTSNSTCEAETVTLCHATEHDGFPTLILFDPLFAGARRPVELVAKVDNTQAISGVTKGYCKKLKFLESTHKRSVGSVHELMQSGQLVFDYAPALTTVAIVSLKCCYQASSLKP